MLKVTVERKIVHGCKEEVRRNSSWLMVKLVINDSTSICKGGILFSIYGSTRRAWAQRASTPRPRAGLIYS